MYLKDLYSADAGCVGGGLGLFVGHAPLIQRQRFVIPERGKEVEASEREREDEEWGWRERWRDTGKYRRRSVES